MRDQMENSVAHSQMLVAKCDHFVAVWSPYLNRYKLFLYTNSTGFTAVLYVKLLLYSCKHCCVFN